MNVRQLTHIASVLYGATSPSPFPAIHSLRFSPVVAGALGD